MKYIDEFRDDAVAQTLAGKIARLAQPQRNYSFMEFCGGHTHAISRYGLSDLLPANVRMVHGPGCPVCVLPIGRIDMAIKLALQHNVILCSYGDTLRVPASDSMSLLKAKARGGDIRMVYSTLDALQIARDNPGRSGVFCHRLRDHHAAHRAGHFAGCARKPDQLQRAVLPRAHACCHHPDSGIARSAAMGHGADRRFHWSGACVHRDRQPAL
jgi:hydrogenase maturation factor